MSGRLVEAFIPLGTDGPSWRLEPAGSDWRLGDWDELYRSSLLDVPVEAPPVVLPGPMAPPPAGLQPIDGMPVVRGLAMPWNHAVEIRDRSGHFIEEFERGAFQATLRDRENPVMGLFSHGQDGSVGYKALGVLNAFESERGLEFEMALLNAPYVLDLLPMVRHELLGSSVRFSTTSERVRSRPGRSEGNPRGLEHRRITGATLTEISRVTFPAYGAKTTASIA